MKERKAVDKRRKAKKNEIKVRAARRKYEKDTKKKERRRDR